MTDRPFRLRTVRVHGHDVTYRMAGEGPTVVLIRWPLPPLPAAVRHRPEPDPRTSRMSNDTRWLLHFSLVVLGLIAILTIALLVRG